MTDTAVMSVPDLVSKHLVSLMALLCWYLNKNKDRFVLGVKSWKLDMYCIIYYTKLQVWILSN